MKDKRPCFTCYGDKWEQIEFDNGFGLIEPCHTCEGSGEVEEGCHCSAYCSCECLCGSWYDIECNCCDGDY